ncbi:MAG TPA: CHASE3 domain-containing protein [Xanthobacteraceae bacterium]|nr:CHASE3 domain-containing protein [Xanthobacteraceae bacterium]
MSLFNNWTVGRRLIVGFGLSALTLLLIAVVSYRNTNLLIENDALVEHSHQVRLELADVLSVMKDAETGQRGYVITGDESYLDPYKSALNALPATLADLRKLTADSAEQQRRLASITPIIETKLNELKAAVDLRRAQGFDAAAKLITTNTGKTHMDQIRAAVAAADQEARDVLKQRTEEARASADLTQNIILWGGLSGTLAVCIIGWLIASSLSQQIGSAVGLVRSSSTELQAAANQQASGAKEQATAMAEISTTISELLATSRQIAESAQRDAHNVEETANAARSGHGTVDQTHESISSIRGQVDQIVSHMLELGKKSQEIGAVIDIVSELAEQTNILAINATIEAAGAGEAGKRFAVVAKEIRNLADRVGGSTKEVRALIEDVRSAVNTTVMATETGSKAVDAGSRQFGDLALAFRQIVSLVSTTTDAAREIELSTKQQSTAVEQVNVAVANVTQASMETETSAGQTLQTVSQMASLSKDLLRIITPHMAA